MVKKENNNTIFLHIAKEICKMQNMIGFINVCHRNTGLVNVLDGDNG